MAGGGVGTGGTGVEVGTGVGVGVKVGVAVAGGTPVGVGVNVGVGVEVGVAVGVGVGARTCVVVLAVSSVLPGPIPCCSFEVVAVTAVLVIVPAGAETLPTMAIEALASALSVPRLQVMVGFNGAGQLPWVGM